MHNYIDPDMRELIDALSKCIVPNHKAVWRTNHHSPYYSQGRYKRVAWKIFPRKVCRDEIKFLSLQRQIKIAVHDAAVQAAIFVPTTLAEY